jgi:glycosyltransferase involved in cell wall biosynthesis
VAVRVLFVLPSLSGGGAERAVLRLLEHLPRSRVEPQLALVARRGERLEEVPGDVVLHDLRTGRVRWAALPLARLAWRVRPQVIFATLGHLNLLLLAIRGALPRGTRLVVREANPASAVLEGLRSGRAWACGYRTLYPRADAIVCPSRAVLEDLATRFGIPRARLRHIPNPIDPEAIRREARGAPSPYPSPGCHVLAVGRLAAQKGHALLLEAFARLSRRIADAELWVLGEGPERARLEAKARELGIDGRVHLPGYVRNPFAWMGHASVFVQSSRFEGLPNALLEALALGVPAVALDEPGGTREALEGVPGTTLVTRPSATDLADAIEVALAIRGAERPSLPHAFRPSHVVRAYVDLFESLASGDAPSG